MSYPVEKALPLAIATLEDVIKMVVKKDKSVSDEALETIFVSLKDNYKLEDIDIMLFKLHAACSSAVRLANSKTFEQEQLQKKMSQEYTYEKAAQELMCSVSQIKKLVKEKKLIPKHYSLRTVRITHAAIEEYRNMYSKV